MALLDGSKIEVIAYFMFETIKERYIIYNKPEEKKEIYVAGVEEKDGFFSLNEIQKSYSFMVKKFIKELMNNELSTVKGYRYFNLLPELPETFHQIESQKIILTEDQKQSMEDFIKRINEQNEEILAQARDEYYLHLVDEKAKERRTIIILLTILIITLSLIAKMIVDFI